VVLGLAGAWVGGLGGVRTRVFTGTRVYGFP